MRKVRIVVQGTSRPVAFCPVSAPVQRSARELDECTLIDVARDVPVPFQTEKTPGGSRIHWIVDSLAPGQRKEYLLRDGGEPAPAGGVAVEPDGDGRLRVTIGRELLTRYLWGDELPRPCLYPLIGPFGHGVTRAYPQEELEGDVRDHVHHRSVFVAWGDVNGSDNWSEEPGSGRVAHRYFEAAEGGPVFGRIVSLNDWLREDGRSLMQDRLEYRFFNVPRSCRLIDMSVTFYASEGEVRFGDTKEGGFASVRVATSMTVERGGRIENSFGGTNEAETWGRRAHWCDYSGPAGGHTVGIALFDHPANLRHPTYWHVRDYGLMTANPFGLSHFVGPEVDGTHVLPAGKHLCFRYRIFVHAGNAAEGEVSRKYLEWLYPPTLSVQD